MRVTARTDYAIRAMAEIAAAAPDGRLSAQQIAEAQDIPLKFLLAILADLRQAGLIHSLRGREGGWVLARPAETITLADVIRSVDGPLATVRDLSLSQMRYRGAAAQLPDVWRAVRASLRAVLEPITIADLAGGTLPPQVREQADTYLRENAERYPAA